MPTTGRCSAIFLAERLPREDLDARLRWLYEGNPAGRALVWVAFDAASGEPTGLTTFFPRTMWIDGETVLGALGGDMYVRPQFRRRGIGAELFRHARRDMDRFGIRVMFGTPMRPNVTALRSSGSTVPEQAVMRYARLLRASAERLQWVPRPAARIIDRLLAVRPRPGLGLEPVEGVDRRIDRIWEETRGELQIATVRDAAFYAWRFVAAPSKRQRPYVVVDGGTAIAACALETVGEKLRIVDLVAPARRWRRALIAIASTADHESGLEMRLATADGARRHLWTMGLFPRDSDPMSMLTPESWSDDRALAMHDPARWFLTWADTDIDHV
jgi:GNAT superfamily N-acetyltransferase